MRRSEVEIPAPRMRVRVVYVKLKARRWGIAAAVLGVIAAVVLPFLVGQRAVSAGLWMLPFVLLPVVCAAVSLYFFRTEEVRPRRVFD